MSNFSCYKNTKENIDKIEIKDGQMLFAVDEKSLYFDHKTERIKIAQGDKIQSTDDIEEGENNKYDKILNLTAGEGIKITGVYPAFEISGTNKPNSSSTSSTVNGYSLLTRYCVNYGKMEAMNGTYAPNLFDTDLDFYIDEENPLLVTFANGKTKLFTEVTNLAKSGILSASINQENETVRYIVYIDEEGNIDYFAQPGDYYKIVYFNSFQVIPNYNKAFLVKMFDGDYIDSYKKDVSSETWMQKSIVLLGEFVVTGESKKAITYEYNKNGLSDNIANQVFNKVKIINETETTLDYSIKNYQIDVYSSKTVKILSPPLMDFVMYNENSHYLAQFNLIIYIHSLDTEINLITFNDYPVVLNGDVLGSKGKGKYLIELYLDKGDYRFYGYCKFIGEPYNPPLPDIDVDDGDNLHDADIKMPGRG